LLVRGSSPRIEEQHPRPRFDGKRPGSAVAVPGLVTGEVDASPITSIPRLLDRSRG
jgi:hypothetical protein